MTDKKKTVFQTHGKTTETELEAFGYDECIVCGGRFNAPKGRPIPVCDGCWHGNTGTSLAEELSSIELSPSQPPTDTVRYYFDRCTESKSGYICMRESGHTGKHRCLYEREGQMYRLVWEEG